MKKAIKILPLLLMAMLAGSISMAQDPQLTQFYNNPVYMNPAYAGATKAGRLAYTYRTQWPDITHLKTTMISTDYFLPMSNKNTGFGFGIFYMNDIAGRNVSLISNNVNLALAIEKPVWKNWRIRGGIQYGFFSKKVGDDVGDLQFEDALITGGGTAEDLYGLAGERISFSDISVGTLLSGKRLWFGLAAHHLNQPNQSITNAVYGDDIDRLPIRWTVNAGWEVLQEYSPSGRSSNTVRIESIYLNQGKNEQFSIGFNYITGWKLSGSSLSGNSRYDTEGKSSAADISLSAGIWLRAIPLFGNLDKATVSTDALAFQLGIETEAIPSLTLGVAYTYDYNLSSLNVTGAHEIMLILRTKQFFKSLEQCDKSMKWSTRRKHPAFRSYL